MILIATIATITATGTTGSFGLVPDGTTGIGLQLNLLFGPGAEITIGAVMVMAGITTADIMVGITEDIMGGITVVTTEDIMGGITAVATAGDIAEAVTMAGDIIAKFSA